jgi:hypothetical protein
MLLLRLEAGGQRRHDTLIMEMRLSECGMSDRGANSLSRKNAGIEPPKFDASLM